MTTKTTTNLQLAARKLDRPEIIAPVAVAVVVLLSLIGALVRHAPAQAELKPIIIVATARPVATPAGVQVAAAKPVRYVVAFASPDGDILGPIPAPDAGAIVARFGDDWLELTWNGGPAWVRAVDIGLRIADLKPARVIAVSAPAPPEQRYQVDQAVPTPDWGHDIATPPPGFVQALIGADPDAPACMGPNGKISVLCGGITNSQAQAALDQQR